MLDAIKQLLERPVAYYAVLAQISGSVNAGLILSQSIYWTPRTDDRDGWFYKTREQWQQELGLKRAQQESARKSLRDRDLLEEKLAGNPARLYFRVNLEAVLQAILLATGQADKMATRSPSRRREATRPDGRKAASKSATNVPALIGTETTSETIPESTEIMHKAIQENHHAYGDALRAWFGIKSDLEIELPEDEYKLWVVPAYLFSVMADRQLLVALPPNSGVIEAARRRLSLLEKLVRLYGYSGASLTRYPDHHELERLRLEHPQFYSQISTALRRKHEARSYPANPLSGGRSLKALAEKLRMP